MNENNIEVVKKYRENGTLEYETPYINGVKHGVEKWYYENGVLREETPYINGLINGVEKTYREDGMLRWETPYKDDVKVSSKDKIEDLADINNQSQFKTPNPSYNNNQNLKDSLKKFGSILEEKRKEINKLNKELEDNSRNNHRYGGQVTTTLFEIMGEMIKYAAMIYHSHRIKDELKNVHDEYDKIDKQKIITEMFFEKQKVKESMLAKGYETKEIDEYITVGMLEGLIAATKENGGSEDDVNDIFDAFIKYSITNAVATNNDYLVDFIKEIEKDKKQYVDGGVVEAKKIIDEVKKAPVKEVKKNRMRMDMKNEL